MTVAIGQAVPRIDGREKVSGAAKYAADFNRPEQAYALIVGASVGRGRVSSMNAAEVEAMPGVLALLHAGNAPRLPYRPHKSYIDPAVGERLHVLQDMEVRYYGQPVALLVARTLEEAERAAHALRISYAAEVPQVDLKEPQAPALAPENADYARGDADAALASAARCVDERYEIARENHNPMEPHATVAEWQGGRLTLWSKSQFVMNEQAELAAIFGLAPEQVEVICPYVGGAFGTSLRAWPHVTLAALAARELERPVKLVLSRRQMFHGTGHRPHTLQRVAIGAREDGRFVALVHEGLAETSRYEQFTEALTTATRYLYSCPNLRTRYRLQPLDTGTPTHMRGPGEASGIYALECAVDELAWRLGMDPLELRLRNEPARDESADKPFSSRSLEACYALGAERFGWARRRPDPRSMRDGRWLVGMGMAAATYPAYQAPSSARVRLLPDGSAEVEVAASDMGPGTYTSMAQVAAETLELPLDRIRVHLGRSSYPPAPSHGGSWTMASVGSAIRAACLKAREERARQGGGGQIVEAEAATERGEEADARYSMHAFGAVFAEVGVDPDLGMIRLRRAVGAYAIGRVINPQLARSQCIGGMIGGLGMALLERTVLDARDGRPVNAHMADYLMPVNLDVPALEAHFVPEEDPHVNPLGVKGLGEIALVGMAPAIANAVYHATGRRVRALPIRIEDVLGD